MQNFNVAIMHCSYVFQLPQAHYVHFGVTETCSYNLELLH